MRVQLRSGSKARWLAALLLVCLVTACATRPPASDPEALADFNETNDPLEPTNRVFYAINNGLDTVILRPLAVAYRYAVPAVVRTHTHNVLANLSNPVLLFNDMFQARPRRAGDTFMRFLINTTIGVVGVFDVAEDLGYHAHDADFGVTLAMWGLPEGPFLFLPVLGPSNPRDAVGFGVNNAIDPLGRIGQGAVVTGLQVGRFAVSAIDARASVLDDLDKIKAEALDPYATIRSLYRQHRASVIEDATGDDRHTVPAWFDQPAAP